MFLLEKISKNEWVQPLTQNPVQTQEMQNVPFPYSIPNSSGPFHNTMIFKWLHKVLWSGNKAVCLSHLNFFDWGWAPMRKGWHLNHGIMEFQNHGKVWLGGDLRHHLVPAPHHCHRQECNPPAQAAQVPILPGLEHSLNIWTKNPKARSQLKSISTLFFQVSGWAGTSYINAC